MIEVSEGVQLEAKQICKLKVSSMSLEDKISKRVATS